jgi:hypothetical protein
MFQTRITDGQSKGRRETSTYRYDAVRVNQETLSAAFILSLTHQQSHIRTPSPHPSKPRCDRGDIDPGRSIDSSCE